MTTAFFCAHCNTLKSVKVLTHCFGCEQEACSSATPCGRQRRDACVARHRRPEAPGDDLDDDSGLESSLVREEAGRCE